MKDSQEYWFSEMGLWGSTPVDTYEFGPKHHSDLYKVFEWVHENQLGDFMAYLQARPHSYQSSWDTTGEAVCDTCKVIVDDFGVM